ncbi:MAG TPA: ABC transporter permease [Candidatus Paceibacterota bacterium]|nr:ABC transporter permease [Candidatus Paceibacterota bacterium]
MPSHALFIAFWTLLHKELVRVFRIWTQTLLPPAITMSLYYLIFGAFIGSRIGEVGGVSYMQFIVPGLVMMTAITNAFSNTASSIFSAKFMKSIEELLVSPMPPWAIIGGFVAAGALRGLIVGLVGIVISLFFTKLPIAHFGVVLFFIVLSSIAFSLAGFFNGLFAKGFDGISIIPTFVLTPLTYLGGVFYSVSALPPFWEGLSKLNPILYLVNGFRYGFTGHSDVSVGVSAAILILLTAVLATVVYILFRRGYGLRN